MSNETMTYSAWRASFQSSEQAAKSAFDDAKRHFNESQKLALVVEDLARQVGALSAQRDELLESGLLLNGLMPEAIVSLISTGLDVSLSEDVKRAHAKFSDSISKATEAKGSVL